MARVHFGLIRLVRETGLPREALLDALRHRIVTLEAQRKRTWRARR